MRHVNCVLRVLLSPALCALLAAGGCSVDKPAQKETPAATKEALAEATAMAGKPEIPAAAFSKPGFATRIEDGRLWILKEGQKESEQCVTLVGGGPGGMTIRAVDRDTAILYLATKPGFKVEADEEGRIWVSRAGTTLVRSEQHVTRICGGPLGEPIVLKALDAETLDAYEAAQ